VSAMLLRVLGLHVAVAAALGTVRSSSTKM
jgi:hypothetical protein